MATRKTNTEDQAAVGAAVGGPVGAAVGAAVAGPIGAAIGSAASWNDAESHFKSHYESGPYKQISSWEEVSPAYRYGFESAGGAEYKGKSYTDVSTHLRQGYKGKGRYEDIEPMIRTAFEARSGAHGQAHAQGAKEAVIPVVEEELAVGKRQVEKGGVRVETTVTETPVQQQVRLHEEHVNVQRRPVDRAVAAGDAAFREGTIELRETAEEAVVQKRARVVEEVVISKHATDRTETVQDTVRRTDVDVEKTGGSARVGATQWETVAPKFQQHFTQHHAKSGASFDEYGPAYRYGVNLAGDQRFRGDWKTVEPEARKHWEATNKGTWDEFKDSIRHAWESVAGKS